MEKKAFNQKPSILLATFTFPPDQNGVAEASAACARDLRLRGWHVEVVTAKASTSRQSFEWEGITVHEFAVTGTHYYSDPYRGELDSYVGLISSPQWDVILFESYAWPLYLALPVLPYLRAKKILVSHGYRNLRWFPVRRFPFGLFRWLQNLWNSLLMLYWARQIDRWVFLHAKSDLDSFFDLWLAQRIKHPGIRVIPNGVPPQGGGNRERFRKTLGIDPSAIVLLMVGYYSKGKDQGFALQSFLKAALPRAVLVFIGTEFNEFSDHFQSLASPTPKEPTSRVIWLERQTRAFTLDAFAGCDIYLSSSYLETQPISILEAMREGVPWIARNAGSISDCPGGVVITSSDEMAAQICKLADNPDLRHRLGQAGRLAISQKYSQQRFSDEYAAMIDDLMAKAS